MFIYQAEKMQNNLIHESSSSDDDSGSESGSSSSSDDSNTRRPRKMSPAVDTNKMMDKNPYKFKTERVRELIRNKELIPNLPTDQNRYSAKHWGDTMWFLFHSESGAELEHWYYCSKCHYLFNLILKNGTGKINHHVEKHKLENKYEFDLSGLAELLGNATEFGAKFGRVSNENFSKNLPVPAQW